MGDHVTEIGEQIIFRRNGRAAGVDLSGIFAPKRVLWLLYKALLTLFRVHLVALAAVIGFGAFDRII